MIPLLSILIPTIIGREKEYDKLVYDIERQANRVNDIYGILIECAYEKDNKEKTIGEKREKLYQMANGLFSLMIDDDDGIAPNGIEQIVLNLTPDVHCLTYREHCRINDKYYSSNHALKYDKWKDNFDGFDYVRSPFYKDVIRTDIAKSIPFEHIRWNEDERWSYAIKPHLKNEIHLDEEIYFYIHNSTDPTERYGLDRS